ncbi:hypothetical protein P5G51_019065 [Virgibacillus sp. 179-BFC.A HS]|uniref:Uncharacterized protein n=1 Tax=Tigheibacillus jepli TaxID=3035914 RepID=A0ABU5CLA9_9BACI|nr:hypothetical protein [Virgibacillus sp. 179-BFC.A HS]MDY0407149.1 hypothetical protein [Virgibacillus sp. 179-BFC.A HS]
MSETEIAREVIHEYAVNHSKEINPLIEMAKEAERHTADSAGDLS